MERIKKGIIRHMALIMGYTLIVLLIAVGFDRMITERRSFQKDAYAAFFKIESLLSEDYGDVSDIVSLLCTPTLT